MSPQVSYITIFIATLIAIVAKDTPNVNGHRLFNVSGIRQIFILWARGFDSAGPKILAQGKMTKERCAVTEGSLSIKQVSFCTVLYILCGCHRRGTSITNSHNFLFELGRTVLFRMEVFVLHVVQLK